MMPKYSALEVRLEDCIDFDKKDNMTDKILNSAIFFAENIQKFLENLN